MDKEISKNEKRLLESIEQAENEELTEFTIGELEKKECED